MSDKSFGDHTNRNIVKNPLLSSAVTGLSLEDLTHKAVLLPVTPSLDQITRSDQQQGSQGHTLAHPRHEITFPSGDAFPNIQLPSTPEFASQNLSDSKKNVNLEENLKTQSATQPKAAAKSDDDFDVNEYIARLHGSRYVSAPLHSHLKDDQNANLEATEENLEEINLNETVPAETQQSLTADIAQNFSQLPTVLPHVASAVFSSFSNMLSYKSREQTPDQPRGPEQAKSAYHEVQFQKPDVGVPLMGVEEYKPPKEVAPPPKDPAVGGTSNFRITTKKKYAQIPGLSSGDTAQTMTYPSIQNIPPVVPSIPPTGLNMPPTGFNMPPLGQNMPHISQNLPLAQNIQPDNAGPTSHHQSSGPQYLYHDQHTAQFAQNVTPMAQSVPNIGQTLPFIEQSEPHSIPNMPAVDQNKPYWEPNKDKVKPNTVSEDIKIQTNKGNTQSVAGTQLYNIFNPGAENNETKQPVSDNQPDLLPGRQNFFTPVEHKELNIPANAGNVAVIPPPPMFSNLPKKDSQSSAGKSILPPSVARRISANQPIIKPSASAPSYTDNIFVPTSVTNAAGCQSDNSFSSGFSSAFVPALPSQMKTPSSISPPDDSTISTTYTIPSQEARPPNSSETAFTPIEALASKENKSIPTSASLVVTTSDLPSTIVSSIFPGNPSFGSTASSYSSMSIPLTSSIFTPSVMDSKTQNAPPPTFQSPLQNVPQNLFNPVQAESCNTNIPYSVTQMPQMATEPPKPVVEPPKAIGNVNFRMTKKRPQYYAGPIEGVGAISNNVKPLIAPVMPSAPPVEASYFQGDIFTPEKPLQPISEQFAAPNIEQASVPFDISRPVELTSPHAAFDINRPQKHACGTSFDMKYPESQNYEQEYNTPFDMSRDSTDPYNPLKQESKGFGIIGSLKSKLSSIDINKIQSTVTTFFDPAYNETKVAEPLGQDNVPHQQPHFGQTMQGQSNLDIYDEQQNQYNRFVHGYSDRHNSQYYQKQDPYLPNEGQTQNISSYSTFGYVTDPNFSTEQVYSSNPLYDNTQICHPTTSNYNLQGNIPQKIETPGADIKLYDPNARLHSDTTPASYQQTFDITYQNKDKDNYTEKREIYQPTENDFDPNVKVNVENLTSSHSQQDVNQQMTNFINDSKEASNMTYYNPNAFTQGAREIWAPQQSQDDFSSIPRILDKNHKNESFAPTSNQQTSMFYNPNVFADRNEQGPKSQEQQFESNIIENIDFQNLQGNNPQKMEAPGSDTKQYDPIPRLHSDSIPAPYQQTFDITYQNKDKDNTAEKRDIYQRTENNDFDPDAKVNVENPTISGSQLDLNQQMTNSINESEVASNMTYYNPNAFTQGTREIWAPQQSQDDFTQLQDKNHKNETFALTSIQQIPTFYNPNAFSDRNEQGPKLQEQQFKSNIIENIDFQKEDCAGESTNEFQTKSQSSCDSALNTSKYNIGSIHTHEVPQIITADVPLLPAASFFDTNMPQDPRDIETYNQTSLVISRDHSIDLLKQQCETNYTVTNKTVSDMPPPIGTKSQRDVSKATVENKDTKFEKEHPMKESNLLESISKNNIPILGVSTVPLFGLSAIIPDKTEPQEPITFDIIHQASSLFESNTVASFFENKEPENKIISENQVKKTPLDITALSINDVKNVLVIEPPQENIGALLKRNASSNKLESLPEKPLQYFKQPNNDNMTTSFHEDQGLKFDICPTEAFFKHSNDIAKPKNLHKDICLGEEQPELNICVTCREVNTPELETKHKDTEDLTSQLIENITSRMQLSNPLTVPLEETDAPITERSSFDEQQLDEITQVAEETFETLHMQSATKLLNERTTSEIRDYGWTTQETIHPNVTRADHDFAGKVDFDTKETKHNYGLELNTIAASNLGKDNEFKIDSNAIEFFDNNLLFFDNLPVPTNASDEIKAEIKHSHEDVVVPRQISIPTTSAEEGKDPKLDETGVIDVHSIEQDANKDFPLEEEFIIEPSTDDFLSTDDDKIESRERKRSSEDSTSNDTFTNRIEKFKKKIDNPDDGIFEQKSYGSPPIPMASYFDTGNYAVESHFRNSLVNMRIPPGFEEEYVRKLSGVSLGSTETTTEPLIPETSTQTRNINTPTYSSPFDTKENIIGSEIRRKEQTEILAQAIIDVKEATGTQANNDPAIIAEPTHVTPVVADASKQTDILTQNVQSLPNPINFFSTNVEEPKSTEPAAPESYNRLASYFSMPPAQPDHSKSFFELSQSQNHYRHEHLTQAIQKPFFELSQSQNHYIDDDTKNNIKELMKDLTSPQNITEHSVKTVNYFTVELNNDIKRYTNATPINVNTDEINKSSKITDSKNAKQKDKLVVNDYTDKDSDDIMKCKYCSRYIPGVNTKVFIVKTAVNEPSEPSSQTEMSSENESTNARPGTTVNIADYDVEKQAEGNVTAVNEVRAGAEYTPVKHHWFYRVDVEEKSVWRGFSNTDSTALEEAFISPDLNEQTLVATDGGRYDVNIVGRLRLAVYWKEKPTNVRRCSWFYKGTTDARYVPYTESVAEKLEEEYRHGLTTGEWHRKLVLPNNEMVIMHGPTVMVHFLHSGATDAFSTPPNLLGKRVYRNTPKIRMARDQEAKIDHLIFIVHGAGEYKRMRYLDQAAARPRVVRRSHEESEIEESEPSKIDHLLLLCHGVGSACDMRFRSVEEVVEDFRATSLQLLQSHYRQSYDNGAVSRVEVLPISWHEQLHSGEMGVDKRLARVTLDSIPRLRAFTNHTVLDVLFYTSPVFHQTIIDTVCFELNRIYSMFRKRNPHFDGAVSLGGHSLGSVILYDLLCHQSPESPLSNEKRYVSGTAGTGQPVQYPQLGFAPAALYALGSPIAIFECIRGVDSLGTDFALPTCKNFFNIFHPYDPIAYRIEPLISPQLQDVKPSQIPHHKGRKRMHLELKDTMARVGADLKQKLIESLRTTWNKWKATPPTDGQLEKVVEEEMEKEQLTNEEDTSSDVHASAEMLGRLNSGRRVDYVLQEAPLEMINEYLFAMSSHVGYWESEDTMLLMLREIYDSLGVQPDSTVPQQSMTVQRTKNLPQDEAGKLSCELDSPSTSRGCS